MGAAVAECKWVKKACGETHTHTHTHTHNKNRFKSIPYVTRTRGASRVTVGNKVGFFYRATLLINHPLLTPVNWLSFELFSVRWYRVGVVQQRAQGHWCGNENYFVVELFCQ